MSDSIGYEWLTTIFKPETKPSTPQRRLLVTDGHLSHLTAKFIAFCLDRAIDLIVLPLHSSHILQPLDVAVFSPLKTFLSAKTDRLSHFDAGRISKVEWTTAYIMAREKAFVPRNISLLAFKRLAFRPFRRFPSFRPSRCLMLPLMLYVLLQRQIAINQRSKQRS